MIFVLKRKKKDENEVMYIKIITTLAFDHMNEKVHAMDKLGYEMKKHSPTPTHTRNKTWNE